MTEKDNFLSSLKVHAFFMKGVIHLQRPILYILWPIYTHTDTELAVLYLPIHQKMAI